MPVVPNPLTRSGQRPEFKGEGSARRILSRDAEVFQYGEVTSQPEVKTEASLIRNEEVNQGPPRQRR